MKLGGFWGGGLACMVTLLRLVGVSTTPTDCCNPLLLIYYGKVIVSKLLIILIPSLQTPLRNPMGLEDDAFPLGVKRPIFRGKVIVSFREGIIFGATGGPLLGAF